MLHARARKRSERARAPSSQGPLRGTMRADGDRDGDEMPRRHDGRRRVCGKTKGIVQVYMYGEGLVKIGTSSRRERAAAA